MEENRDEYITDLYNKYHHFVKRVCLGVIYNEAIASDMASIVWMQVVTHINEFRGDAAITSYLYRIAINQCRMHMRRLATRSEFTTPSGDMPDSGAETNIDDNILIKSAINNLPKGYKQMIKMRYIDGYTSNEIGEKLGVHPGTSKSQIHKSLKRLKDLINGDVIVKNRSVIRQSRQKML